MTREKLIKIYLMGWRRGAGSFPRKIPADYAKLWGYAARRAFLEGYESGVRSRRSALARAKKEVGGSQS